MLTMQSMQPILFSPSSSWLPQSWLLSGQLPILCHGNAPGLPRDCTESCTGLPRICTESCTGLPRVCTESCTVCLPDCHGMLQKLQQRSVLRYKRETMVSCPSYKRETTVSPMVPCSSYESETTVSPMAARPRYKRETTVSRNAPVWRGEWRPSVGYGRVSPCQGLAARAA